MSFIEARHVSKMFRTDAGESKTVFHDMSLTLHEGQIVAILGRSGSGKSTFLRVLAGLITPDGGDMLYRGRPVVGPNPDVAMVFQSFALMPWLTVQANVELGLEARGVPRAERRRLAADAIDMIGLHGFERSYPRELSGGMRQRVGIARALVLKPKALFMDEPFSALDVMTAESLRRQVLRVCGEDGGVRSVVMVTHNIAEAVEMADRIVVLGANPGRIIADIAIDAARPRDVHSDWFARMIDDVHAMMTDFSLDRASDASSDALLDTSLDE